MVYNFLTYTQDELLHFLINIILFNFLIKKSLYSVKVFMTMDSQLVNCE